MLLLLLSLLLFLLQEPVLVARMVTGLAISLTIPVQREWKIALINMSVNWTPTNAVVQWNRIQVCTFYLSIKSLCLLISSLGLHTLPWNFSFGTPLFKRHLYSGDTYIQGTTLFKGHLYSGDTSIQGTPLFRGHLYSRDTCIQGTQNLVPKKRPHNLWIYYLYWGDTSIKGKWTLFLGFETWVYETSIKFPIKFLGFTLHGATPHITESVNPSSTDNEPAIR